MGNLIISNITHHKVTVFPFQNFQHHFKSVKSIPPQWSKIYENWIMSTGSNRQMSDEYHSYILVTREQVKIKGVGDLGFLKSTCCFPYITCYNKFSEFLLEQRNRRIESNFVLGEKRFHLHKEIIAAAAVHPLPLWRLKGTLILVYPLLI